MSFSKAVGMIWMSIKKAIASKDEEIMVPATVLARVKNIWSVTPIPEKCTGCMTCMAICSLFHEGKVSPTLAKIRLKTEEEEWLKGLSNKLWEQQVCRQCAGVPPCMAACPVDALYRDEKLGTVLIDYDVCIECMKCIDACPYHAIWYNGQMTKLLKCDTCSGKPKCVEWCPEEALVYKKVC